MKIFGRVPVKKSWSIELKPSLITGDVYLMAVDSYTGEEITILMEFSENGSIFPVKNALNKLVKKGYNTLEHNTRWDKNGAVLIKKF